VDTLHEKKLKLEKYLSELGSVAIAFSSGVDSTFLLKTAQSVLGSNVIAITAKSCSFPERELREAQAFCTEEGIEHFIIESEELSIDGFRQNPKNRCYLCKHELFTKIAEGLQAVAELDVKSPLRIAELTKDEIRALSKEMGLRTWNKQSFACLSSRFVYGETINEEKLGMVDKAEQLLLDLGFHQVRVRVHGNIARIEILSEEFESLIRDDIRNKVTETLKKLGFSYITMDLIGYRTGSMNETMELQVG